MLSVSGAAYQSGMAGISGTAASVVKATVGSRSALTCTAASGTHRAIWQANAVACSAGAIGTSTDTAARALAVDAWLALSTLSIASGAVSDVLTWTISDPGWSTSSLRYCHLSAYYDGAAYSLLFRSRMATETAYDTVSLGTVAADSSYHTIHLWIFRDKVYYQVGTGTASSASFTTAQTATVYAAFPSCVWTGGACIAAWDALRMAVEEYPLSATAGTSETNGHADDGVVYLVEKTALAGLVTAGTAYELTLTAGAFTEAAASDKDYLCCKVGSDNSSGYGVKLNKSAGGAWTKSAWSLI